MVGPVFLAETKQEGFPEFLKKTIPAVRVETRPGAGRVRDRRRTAVEAMAAALDAPAGGFKGTPFYTRIAEAYRGGAGMLLCADLVANADTRCRRRGSATSSRSRRKSTTRWRCAPRWLRRASAPGWPAGWRIPRPMGSLDYVSPEATFVAAFVVKDPRVIVDQLVPVGERVLGLGAVPAEQRRSEERPGRRAWAASSRCRSTGRSSRRRGNWSPRSTTRRGHSRRCRRLWTHTTREAVRPGASRCGRRRRRWKAGRTT